MTSSVPSSLMSNILYECWYIKISAIRMMTLRETSQYASTASTPLTHSIKVCISLPNIVDSISIGIFFISLEELLSSFAKIFLNYAVFPFRYFLIIGLSEEALRKFKIESERVYFSMSSSSISTILTKFLSRILTASLTVFSPNLS
jgi:hypothetical protein